MSAAEPPESQKANGPPSGGRAAGRVSANLAPSRGSAAAKPQAWGDHTIRAPAPVARIAIAGLVALALLAFLWEMVLAPLRPGGTWLALKALPLGALIPHVARAKRRARQIATLVLPWYAAEGLVRAASEHGRHALVAGVSGALALGTFVALLVWLRAESMGR